MNRILTGFAATLTPALAIAQSDCPDLTGLQRAVGFITLTNIFMVFAIIMGVICLLVLFGRWIELFVQLLKNVPVELYEAIGYLLALGLVLSGLFLPTEIETWTSLIGSLLLGGLVLYSLHRRQINTNEVQVCTLLFVLWVPIALLYQNSFVGFFAIFAAMGALGFSVWILPFGYALGFQKESYLGRATTSALMIMLLAVISRITPLDLSSLRQFEQGALWIGSFVGYLGLLIAASERFKGKHLSYWAIQALTLIAGLFALVVGTLFDIAPLLGIGGTFFALYLIEKFFELPIKSPVAWALAGLILASVIGGFSWWAQNNYELIAPYLLF